MSEQQAEIEARANDVKETFRLSDGVFIVGSLERGVTVYKQQVRAHNLVWALWELERRNVSVEKRKVAVVGGGIAGLTTAACILSLFDQETSVVMFERLWDLCPYQQGCDIRWLHPRIYDWPDVGSRKPSTSLPVLTWAEGRASDVAKSILSELNAFGESFDTEEKRFQVFVGVTDLRITASKKQVEWKGTETFRKNGYYQNKNDFQDVSEDQFDLVIIASGFGFEDGLESSGHKTESYWRNEQIGQPIIDGTRDKFLISGYGDGALTDLFRLTIERFRQDTILYEIFGNELTETETYLKSKWNDELRQQNLFDFFSDNESTFFKRAIERLSVRIRKDTDVVLHACGSRTQNKEIRDIFDPKSSFFNRMLTYMLFRCDAFVPCFLKFEDSLTAHAINDKNVIRRLGCSTKQHLKTMFNDFENVETRIDELDVSQPQKPKLFWVPGTFPVPTRQAKQ